MTLVEIKNQLVGHFLKEDTFSLKDHLKTIKVGKGQDKNKEGMVFGVLMKLEEEGLIMGSQNEENISFTLFRPLGSEGHQVMVSTGTANMIADIVNDYREAIGISGGVCDKLDITDLDLQNLCYINAQLMQGVDKKQEEQ